MSIYVKQNFENGKKLDAEQLNYIEDGIINHSPYNGFSGKTVSFLADSITTYEDPEGFRWIPSGYAMWYYISRHSTTGIDNVNKTWWKQVLNKLGMKLCVNAAWSGSKVTGNSKDTSGSVGCGDGRISALTVKEGVKSECPVGTKPDIIIIFIGINDFGYGTTDYPVGNWDMSTLPKEGVQSTFDTSYALCVSKIMKTYPEAEVFCCTLLETSGTYDSTSGWPLNNDNAVKINEYNKKIREIAHLFGAKIIDLHACGITYFNASKFCVDKLHPNAKGANLIARKAISDICAQSIYSNN